MTQEVIDFYVSRPEPAAPEPLSVTAALGLAKLKLEGLTLSILGEISDISDNLRYKAVYFTLADEGAALSCLMWRNVADKLGIQLKSGMKLEVRGRFTLYAAKGRMQFEVKHLSLAGEGQLRAQVAALAARLEAEGLMDQARKRMPPPLPESVALITSPHGKAVHDVLRTLKRRLPLVRVLFFGIGVEGAMAAPGIISALQAAQHSEAELVLLVRGGGSYEDLMPFNDEALARALAACTKPVITGIGHEPDTTIADMVASLRASTPTAAAESATPHTDELLAQCKAAQGALVAALAREVQGKERELEQTTLRLEGALPLGMQRARHTLAELQQRLKALSALMFARHEAAFSSAAASLESLSPLAVLARGYSITYDSHNAVARSIQQIAPGQSFTVRLANGVLRAQRERE